MNTKYKLDRQVVLTLCVLLTAMWLPLTTFAKDVSNTVDPARGANTHADKYVRCQSIHDSMDYRDCQHLSHSPAFLPGYSDGTDDSGVGFAETDPTVQDSLGNPTISPSTVVHSQNASVGFTETDPANQNRFYGFAVSKAHADGIQQPFVGFAETDPANHKYLPAVEIQNQHLVVCPHINVNSVADGAQGFSRLSGDGHCHDHS